MNLSKWENPGHQNRGPPRGFGEQGKRGIYFRGTGEQRSNFEGNRGTKTILGNREHKKTKFRFLGNRGTSQFISGEQGNRYPLGRPQNRNKFEIHWFQVIWHCSDTSIYLQSENVGSIRESSFGCMKSVVLCSLYEKAAFY